MAQSDRVDETISPAQFQGRGPQFSLATQHALRGMCFGASLHGSTATLSAMGGSAASETLAQGDLSFTALRPLGSAAIGGELRGSLTGTTHRYADPEQNVAGFRLGIVSVGPAARWSYRAMQVNLSGALVSLVDHPYTELWRGGESARPHIAWLTALRSANATISLAPPFGRALGMTATYETSLVRYDDTRSVRSLTQRLGLGFWLGRGHENP